MKKVYLGSAAAVAAVGMFLVISSAFAVGAVTPSCSGTVAGNVVTWSATSTGGNAPYTFAWSGDPSVAGVTSTLFAKTYAANGTYNATVTATDASSTSASANCSAVVTANAAPTSTLNVLVAVNNAAGGSAVPSSFTVSVTGAGATPGSFTGASAATPVVVNAASSYSVGASALANYTASLSGNCAGPIAAGAMDTCTVTETYVANPTPTPTSTQPRIMPPTLSIGANGQFLARGMKVTSVGTNSFQAQVWGVTYTVNWSGSLNTGGLGGDGFEFWFRYGPASTSTPAQQLAVGDEVGVAGRVDPSSPLTVNATVVRDYSISAPRLNRERNTGEDNGNGNNGQNNGNGNAFGVGNNSSDTNMSDARSRLNDLMDQLKNLQKLWQERGGKGKGGD